MALLTEVCEGDGGRERFNGRVTTDCLEDETLEGVFGGEIAAGVDALCWLDSGDFVGICHAAAAADTGDVVRSSEGST
jgi:hypothetical protein